MTSHRAPRNGTAVGLDFQSEEIRLRAQVDELAAALNRLSQEHGELNSRYRYLQKELERAGRVQQSLLPQSLRPLKGYHFAAFYRPCEAVGGDFYDVIHGDDGAFILICDVVGHGLEASLTTMLLKAVFAETARAQSRPDGLLGDMNEKLHRVIPSDLFAVATAVKLTTSEPEIEIANAGLPYPFVLRSSSGRVDELSLSGFPLGLLDGVQYEGRTIALDPGDVLLLGTDGIRSISNEEGEPFETDHLESTLRMLVGQDGKKVIETLMATALKFGNGNSLQDDVNLVAVTKLGAAPDRLLDGSTQG